MSNKTRLEAVSSALDTAIATANSLPEAGSSSGGTSLETWTVRIDAGTSDVFSYIGLDDTGNIVPLSISPGHVITNIDVVANSFVVVYRTSAGLFNPPSTSIYNAVRMDSGSYSGYFQIYQITGDNAKLSISSSSSGGALD